MRRFGMGAKSLKLVKAVISPFFFLHIFGCKVKGGTKIDSSCIDDINI